MYKIYSNQNFSYNLNIKHLKIISKLNNNYNVAYVIIQIRDVKTPKLFGPARPVAHFSGPARPVIKFFILGPFGPAKIF